MNDDSDSTVAAVRQVTGEDGSCMMNFINIALEHTVGKRTRSKSKQIVECFEPGESVPKSTGDMFNYIFSKQTKNREQDYIQKNALLQFFVV